MAKKVNNKEFYEELKHCIIAYRECTREDKSPFEFVTPKLSQYFEDMILKVMSNKNWFRNTQPFDKDDIVQNCRIQLWQHYHKFNIEKTNPFAYFTTMIINAAIYEHNLIKQKKGDRRLNTISLYQNDSTNTLNITQI